jgi:autotransporter-associated beta strand protein
MKMNTAGWMVATLALVVGLLGGTAQAAGPYYWDNDGATPGFGTPAAGTWAAPTIGNGTQGWSTDITGSTVLSDQTTATTDTLNFGNGGSGLGAGTITVGTVSAGNMTFASGSGAIVLSGGTITLAAAATITVDNTADTISSILAGAATSLTKLGTGTITLSGVNTYSGATVISAGMLKLSAPVLSVSLTNPSFETDAGTVDSFKYMAITGWTGGNGIEQGASRTFAPAAPPNYNASTNFKWAFIQNAQTMSQTINVITPGVYTVGFAAVGRAGVNGPLNIQVQVDGVNQSAVITPSQAAWNTYSSSSVFLSAGSHTLSFVFINALGGDRSSDIDAVTVTGTSINLLPTSTPLSIAAGATLDLTGASQTIDSLTDAGGGGGTVTNSSASTATLTINPSSGSTTFSGGILGAVGVVKAGIATQILSGNNTYTGGTLVSGGTLTFAGSSSGTLGAITVSGGGTTELKIQAGNYTLGGGGVFVGSGNGAGIVSQTGGVVSWNSNSLQLLIGNGGFAGTYNLSGGSLTTLTGLNSRGVMLGVNSGSSATFNLSGTGTLTVAGTSRLMIGRSDATQVNTTNLFSQTGGTATISDMTMGGTSGGAGSGNSATLTLTGGTFTATAFSLLSAANNDVSTINIGDTAVVTLPNLPIARGSGATAIMNFDGGTLKNSATGTFITGLNNAFIKAGGATFDTSLNNTTISQNLLTHGSSLNGGLTKIGANTLTLSGANTYTGPTTINASGGSLILNNLNAIANSSSVSVASGTSLRFPIEGTYATAGTISIVGTGLSTLSNPGALWFGQGGSYASTLNAPITLGGATTFSSFGNVMTQTLGGAITGTGPLTISSTGGGATDTGVWTLNAASSYSGNTIIKNGSGLKDITVKLGIANALPITTSLDLTGVANTSGSFATLDLNGFDQTLAGLTDSGTSSAASFGKRVINSNATLSTLTINNAGAVTYGTTAANVLAGTIGGTTAAGVAANNLALIKTGAGTLTLTGASSFTGDTTINGGTLSISGSGSLGGGSYAGAIANTGTLQYSSSANQTLSGAISGAAGILIKDTSATSTLTLSGTTTYTGATTVNAGTLLVNSPASLDANSAVTVAAGATLGGSGAIAGTVNAASGANLSPGASAGVKGILSLANTLTLNGVNLRFDVTSAVTPGTTYDQIANTTGSLVVDGVNTVYLNYSSGAAAGTYWLLTCAGTPSGSGSVIFPNGTTTWGTATLAIVPGGVTLTISSDINDAIWEGTSSSVWDTTTANWRRNGAGPALYQDNDLVTFDNTGTAQLTVTGAGSPGLTTVDSTSNYILNANIGGSGALIKSGSAMLRLGGTSTYGGGTVINAGTVWVTTDANLGAAGSIITFNSSAALSLGDNTAGGQAINLGSRPITLNNGAFAGLYFNGANKTITVSGAITGTGGIIWGRDPVVTYSGGSGYEYANLLSTGNNFTGPITIGVSSSENIGVGSDFTFNSLADSTSPMTFNFGGGPNFNYGAGGLANLSLASRPINLLNSSATFRNLNATYTITYGAVSTSTAGTKTLNLGAGGAGGVIAGNITNGSGTLAVNRTVNTGTWTLSGTNTYSGITGADNAALTIRGKDALSPNSIISFDSSNGSAGGGGGRLNLRINDAGVVSLGNQVNVRSAQTGALSQWTIDVNRFDGANTGSTLVLGKMNFHGAIDSRTASATMNVLGGNGYRLQFSDVDLTLNLAGVPQFNPTTAPLTIVGTVKQVNGKAASYSNNGVVTTYRGDYLTLGGTASGNLISGLITDATDFTDLSNGNARPLNIIKSNTSVWDLSNLNTYSGNTYVIGGTLGVNNLASGGAASSIGKSTAAAVNLVLGAGTLQYAPISAVGGAGATIDRNFTITGSGTIDASGTGALVFSQSGNISPDVTGLTGTTTAGTVQITGLGSTANLAIGMGISMTGVPGGRTIASIDSASQITFSGNSTGVTTGTNPSSFGTPSARTLTLTGTNTDANTIAGNLQDSSAAGAGVLTLAKSGVGAWVLSGANTYTGTTTINVGTLSFTKQTSLYNNAQGSWTPTKITVAAGAILALGVGDSASGYFDATALDTFRNGTHMGLSTPTTGFKSGAILGFDTTYATAGVFAYNSNIGNFGGSLTDGLAKLGAGTLVLGGINAYTGTTAVNAGALQATKAAALPGYNAAGKVSVVSGATLAVQAGGAGEWSSAELDSLLGATTAAFASGSKLGIVVASGNPFTYANDIGTTQTAKELVKFGDGILTLSGANTYTGATTINAGTLALGATDVLPTTAVSIGNATLDVGTHNDTVGTLDVTGSATININGGRVAFAASNGVDWGGNTLTLSETFVSGESLRFGNGPGGLTATQLGLIRSTILNNFSLDSNGFLIAEVSIRGTVYKIR